MFNIFNKRNKEIVINESVTKLFDEHGFYPAISEDIKSANKSVIIESPYITIRRSREFTRLVDKNCRGISIVIYTRNPMHHDGNLIYESIEGIKILRNSGIKVITCNDMRHRKIAIIDDSIIWEGSLNMLSQNGSKEIMRRSVSNELAEQMKHFLSIKWYSRR